MNNGTTPTPHRAARWPWVLTVLVAVSGISVSFWAWHSRVVYQRRIINDEFRLEAQNLQAGVEREIRLFMDVLDSIRRLHTLSDRISAADFSEFVLKGMQFQQAVLDAFGFAQAIPHALRPALEPVLEPDGQGGFRRAGQRPEYFPLTYQSPAGGLGVPDGFDFGALPQAAEAIVAMRQQGSFAMAAAPRPDNAARLNYIMAPIMYPVWDGRPVPPPGRLYGFAIALFDPAAIMRRAAPGPSARGIATEFSPADSPADPASPPTAFSFSGVIPVAGRPWLFRCRAGPDFIGARRTSQPEIVLAAGLASTLLLTLLLALLAGRGRRIERIVRQRTADLRRSNELLAKVMAERMQLESEILEISTREKNRIGQDLHDSLGQKLSGAVYLSRALRNDLPPGADTARQEAEQIGEILKESVAQVRRLARGLAPVELGAGGLAAALGQLADESGRLFQAACCFADRSHGATIEPKAAIHLYHIAQEAVNNAARHGQATEIVITLEPDRLTIADNGAGLPPDASARGGLGLRIMQYRAEMIGADLTVEAGVRGGTRVVCSKFQGQAPK